MADGIDDLLHVAASQDLGIMKSDRGTLSTYQKLEDLRVHEALDIQGS